jgi:hypothetical protein
MFGEETAKSKNGVPIRLPDERWLHLTEAHSEMAGYYSDVLETLDDPDIICEGNAGELLAVRKLQTNKYIIVVYKEVNKLDGFVITAFLSSKKNQLGRRRKVWQKSK